MILFVVVLAPMVLTCITSHLYCEYVDFDDTCILGGGDDYRANGPFTVMM